MIPAHQPSIFKDLPVKVAASSLLNGHMSFGPMPGKATIEEVRHNRARWLAEVGLKLEQTTLLWVTYGENISYTRIQTVDATAQGRGMSQPGDGVLADALFTSTKQLGLFLPLADCGGVVLYNAKNAVLGVVHLGRQATFANLATKAIEHMKESYGTHPQDIFVWISPSISGDSYWLHTFAFASDATWQPFSQKQGEGWLVDLQGYNIHQLQQAGVPKEQIEHAQIDTAAHADYPSHYRYKTHGEAEKAGRFAVVAFLQ
ncbi:MAG TPA: laccase domain-containing protein [Candidatus Saccharimonadales bacterium]